MMVVSSLNPAVSLGMIVAVVFKPGYGIQNSGMSWAWIYLVFPWVGSIVAVVVYEFLFKKAQDVVEEHEEVDAEAHLIDQQWTVIMNENVNGIKWTNPPLKYYIIMLTLNLVLAFRLAFESQGSIVAFSFNSESASFK